MKKFILAVVTTLSVVAPVAISAAPAEATTHAQSQAIGEAKDYLRFSAFSKLGLADQLHYEGFSRTVSLYAVNHIKVSWRNQAYKSAKDYLSMMHFSLSGLIDQLEYEKFTPSQAVYGAKRAY
jgi:hypothetical protein